MALTNMIFSQELKTAIWDYFIRNKEQLKFKSITDFSRSFNAQEQVAGNYLAMLDPAERPGALKELAKPLTGDYFRMQIKARLARYLFHDNGYYSISLKSDEVVNKAIDLMNSSRYSDIISGK